jgi:DNA-binding CsgD family transcriptional regulator
MRDIGWLVIGGICGFTWASAVLDTRARDLGLSARQVEILTLVSHGMSTKEIALAQGISVHSVNTHIRRATRTLGVSTRAAAVAALRRQAQAGAPAVTISATSSSNGT